MIYLMLVTHSPGRVLLAEGTRWEAKYVMIYCSSCLCDSVTV